MTGAAGQRTQGFYWTMLIGMQVCVFMCTFDSGVVNLALPVIRGQLNLTLSEVKWVVICYTGAAAMALPLSAWLGRRFGVRRMYLTGVALFSAASGSCGLVDGLPALLVLRVVAAMGVSLILSLNQVIILRVFPREMHGRALGVAGSTFALGLLAGLGAGGVLIHYGSWRTIFIISFPIGLAGLAWNTATTKKAGLRRDPDPSPVFDWAGLLWMAAGFASLSWILNYWMGKNDDIPVYYALPTTAAGLAAAAMWLRHEFSHKETFLHLSLLRIRPLGYNFLNGFSVRVLMGITNFIIPFYLQNVLMLSPASAGLVLVTGAVSMGVLGPFAGAMSDRRGMQKTIALGLTFMGVGLAGYAFLPSTAPDGQHAPLVAAIAAIQALIGCGSTFFGAANTNSSLHSVERDRQASISGLLSVNLMAGAALGSMLGGEFFQLLGGVRHAAKGAGTALLFPPHAFSWLFGFCAIWMSGLVLYAWKQPETIPPANSPQKEASR